jgi:hypothetical protein
VGNVAAEEIRVFLQRLSERYPQPAALFLLGGGALCLLGNPRRTINVDYAITTPLENAGDFVQAIQALAEEMRIEMEIVAIEEFIPLPPGAEKRHIHIDQFGNLAVYIYDPYTIALSKLARGFEADLQDVLFLLQQGFVTLDSLSRVVEYALPHAWNFDVDPDELRTHFDEVRRLSA